MKFLESLRHYINVSNSPSGIDFDAVFQPDYPVEEWSEMFKSINLDDERQRSLIRLVGMVLKKPVESRRDLAEILCKPKLEIYIKKDADKEYESNEIARQLVIYALSCSDDNLKNMKQALENIQRSKS
ncbi:MAG TPA: hypothetical protein VMR19_03820 [Candidatus Saccharimonadales bacterium]|nr:hypothetical protein [Candidatus Saccharimonadales bacterium]